MEDSIADTFDETSCFDNGKFTCWTIGV